MVVDPIPFLQLPPTLVSSLKAHEIPQLTTSNVDILDSSPSSCLHATNSSFAQAPNSSFLSESDLQSYNFSSWLVFASAYGWEMQDDDTDCL